MHSGYGGPGRSGYYISQRREAKEFLCVFASLREAFPLQFFVCVLPFFSCTPAAAQQPKAASAGGPKAAGGAREASPKQITNSIGMKLTLVPSGEFMMGSKESAEATAAFFNKNYGGEFVTPDPFKEEHPQHRVAITKPFYLGTYHVTRGQFRQFVNDSGYRPDSEKDVRPPFYGMNEETGMYQLQRVPHLEETRLRADRRPPCRVRKLERRRGFLQVALQEGGQDLSAADGGRVGICLPGRHEDAVLQRR